MSLNSKFNNRAPRIARPFTVRICEDISAPQARWDIVMAKDLSASGILFNYDRYLDPGIRVRFRIALPVCEPVECEGEVVRNVMGMSRGYGSSTPAVCAVAAEFRDLSERDQEIMTDVLSQYNAEEPEADEQEVAENDTGEEQAKRIERSFPTWIRKAGQSSWEAVPMQSISSTELVIRYTETLELEQGMGLRILLPFSKEHAMLWGTIVRVGRKDGPESPSNIFYISIRFTVIDPALQQQLDKYAERIAGE